MIRFYRARNWNSKKNLPTRERLDLGMLMWRFDLSSYSRLVVVAMMEFCSFFAFCVFCFHQQPRRVFFCWLATGNSYRVRTYRYPFSVPVLFWRKSQKRLALPRRRGASCEIKREPTTTTTQPLCCCSLWSVPL
jgi:hypothetical protein